MSRVCVLDASAVLVWLQQERGHEAVEVAFDAGPCWMSTVNTCEVMGKLCEKGMPPDDAQATLDELGLTVVAFDADQARLAASLRAPTMSIGASLGDRACLALALSLARPVLKEGAPSSATVVYTAEKAWGRLKWPFKVHLIR